MKAKKIFSALTIMALALGLTAVSAFADEPEADTFGDFDFVWDETVLGGEDGYIGIVAIGENIDDVLWIEDDGAYTDEFGVVYDADGNVIDRSALARGIEPISAELDSDGNPKAGVAAGSAAGVLALAAGAVVAARKRKA
jgi:hypothetical protein